MPEWQNNPIRENMSYTKLRERAERGEMLAYRDATNDQLELRRAELLDRINNPRLEGGVWLRDVVMNTVYAAISIGTSLWFGATNILKSSTKISGWLSDKGFLRNASGEPYVANVTELYRKVTDLVVDWGRMARTVKEEGGSLEKVAKGNSPYELLAKVSKLLNSLGFDDKTGLVQEFLDANNGRKLDVTIEEVDELRRKMSQGVKAGTESMILRVLNFFDRATKSAAYSISQEFQMDWVSSRIQSRTNSLFDLHDHNSKIFNRRVAPAVLGAGAVGALAIGYGSWKAAREREAFVDSSELGHVERLLHERDSRKQAQEEGFAVSSER